VRRLARDARVQNDQLREWRFTRLLEQVVRQKEQIRQALLKDDQGDSADPPPDEPPASD
jgi:hypothetical protein